MPEFDYDAPAEFYASPTKGMRKFPMRYQRFATSAEAIQFAVEKLPEPAQNGAILEVNEMRFEPPEIRELYDSPRYPLKRAK
jgi:hypothetical protein